jgi:hypothetical protein
LRVTSLDEPQEVRRLLLRQPELALQRAVEEAGMRPVNRIGGACATMRARPWKSSLRIPI